MEIVKQRQLVEDSVELIAIDADINSLPNSEMIVPVDMWLQNRDALSSNNNIVGVLLNGEDSPEEISNELARFSIIAISFPAFRDGRGYSQAQQLRQRFSYQGEIRAVGNVLRDQLAYMERVGFDSFVIDSVQDVKTVLSAFDDISVLYQASSDEPTPLYRRRA